MVIYYFHYMRYLNLIAMFFKHQSIWMHQVNCILPLPIISQWMTSPNAILNHHLYSFCRFNFSYTHLDFF